jgi:hypothetical protein
MSEMNDEAEFIESHLHRYNTPAGLIKARMANKST